MQLDRIVGRTAWDRIRFLISILMDLIGYASYSGYAAGPGAAVTEGSDFIFGPIQATYLALAYGRLDSLLAAGVGLGEEMLPFTDAFPTCTLYHIYVMRRKYAPGGADELPAAGFGPR